MHTMKINVGDNVYNHIIYMIKHFPDIDILEDTISDEDFKVDENYCVEVSEQIKKGDYTDFKKGTAQELFDDLGI